MRWSMLAILFIVRLAMGYQSQSIGSVSTQLVPVAIAFGWQSVMAASTAAALLALLLTAGAYRAPPGNAAASDAGPLRIGLPGREAVHISIVGIGWAAFNASLIVLVSFAPDALVAKGWAAAEARSAASLLMWATLVSLPLGGRLMEKFGYVTPGIAGFLLLAASCACSIFMGWAPAAMFVLCGLAAGVPGGALLALTSQATTPANRGPGLGVFYTWYCAGMTIAPAVAGWLRDTLQEAGAPVLFAGALMVVSAAV